ncbi:MAG: hypothetical protein AAB547_00315 [Patescibacteria group bacterium]|mgnify:CR=1 FL=1
MAGTKKTLAAVKAQVASGIDKGRRQAEREMAKVKQQIGASLKKVNEYVRKNPEKAAMVSAGIGAALGAAVALLLGGKKKK